MKTDTQKVVFRASRRKPPEISAVLLGQEGSPTVPLMVWDSQCGHGSGSWQWYYKTRPAKPSQYAGELKLLERQYAPEFRIEVRQRIGRGKRPGYDYHPNLDGPAEPIGLAMDKDL